jgi:excisionase family DNA binding protein
MKTDGLFTTEELAEFLGLSPRTLKDWRNQGKGPKSVRIGHKTIRYRKEDVDSWIKRQKKTG